VLTGSMVVNHLEQPGALQRLMPVEFMSTMRATMVSVQLTLLVQHLWPQNLLHQEGGLSTLDPVDLDPFKI